MTIEEIKRSLSSAQTIPLQPLLRKIGIPRETKTSGPMLDALLTAIQCFATAAERTPTGWEVEPEIGLTENQLRMLEVDIGRPICNSGDVLFGSLQVGLIDDEIMQMYTKGEIIDLRHVRAAD